MTSQTSSSWTPRRMTLACVVLAVLTLPVSARVAKAQSATAAATPLAVAPTLPAPGTVTISLADYDRLLDRIATRPVLPAAAPARAVVSRAALVLRLDESVARAVITLQGEVLRSGPTAVPLLSGGTLLDAQAGGQTVPVTFEKGSYQAILPGPGAFSLVVTWASPIVTEPGRAWVQLPAINAGSVRATIDALGENPDVRIDAGMITSRTSAGGRGIVEAILSPAAVGRVSWSSREVAAAVPARALRLLSDVKTLVTVGDDLRLTSLFDVTVVQGTPQTFDVRLPEGFDVRSVSGATVDVRSEQPGRVQLAVADPERRRHQFLVALERSTNGASTRDIGLPRLDQTQREAGEVALEGVGALELRVDDHPSLTRIDAGEVTSALQSLAREPLLAAYRYQRRTTEPVTLALSATRFPDAPVLTAVAERAVATTLVTAEGRALTEVTLTVRNQAHPFLKVGLPEGAVLLSAEVAGAPVKPAQGSDGSRVPLLRTGFEPKGPYVVSFVYLHAGAPFLKKGDTSLALARMDVPIGWLEWEVFLPDRVAASRFDSRAFAKTLVDSGEGDRGRTLREGKVVGSLNETVTVGSRTSDRRDADEFGAEQPSVNVQNLQRRAAGVLPVRIDVPRAGRSHVFVRPLIVNEETTLTFRYRTSRS